jgi:DNA-binding transcriptional LysR family regulator
MESPIAREDLSALSAFAVVAQERSFTRAAVKLGISRSAVSHSIRTLEGRLGVRLLARTTRNVAVTEAGERLIAHLHPALTEIQAALSDVGHFRNKPAGVVRLVSPPMILATLLGPRLGKFSREYPDIVLDVTSENDPHLDLVAGQFDAGIHLGEFLEKDMVAVKVSGPQRAAIVAAPSYFREHPQPRTPRDLTSHRCLGFRHAAGGEVYRWEFEKRGKPMVVSVSGPLIVNDVELLIRAALDGVGLAFTLEEHVAAHIDKGRLVRVLADWCPPFDGYFLYYPASWHQRPALQALIAALRA